MSAVPTVAVAGDGVALLYISIILLVLTWITVVTRVCVRAWRKVLGMDDYLMVVGLVSIRHSMLLNVRLMTLGFVLGDRLPLHSLLLLWLWAKS